MQLRFLQVVSGAEIISPEAFIALLVPEFPEKQSNINGNDCGNAGNYGCQYAGNYGCRLV